MSKTYLGNGVWAERPCFDIVLTTYSGITPVKVQEINCILLDDKTMGNLIKFSRDEEVDDGGSNI